MKIEFRNYGGHWEQLECDCGGEEFSELEFDQVMNLSNCEYISRVAFECDKCGEPTGFLRLDEFKIIQEE